MPKNTILLAIRAPNFLPYIGDLIKYLRKDFKVVIVFDKRFSKKFEITEKVYGPHDTRKHFRYTLKHLAGVLTYNLDSSSNLKYQRRWSLYLSKTFRVIAAGIRFVHLDALFIKIIRSTYKVLKLHQWTFEILDEIDPTLIIVVPGNNRFSVEDDYLLAGHERGITTTVIVPTWDSITNKGTWISSPDVVFCWNSMHAAQLEKHRLSSEIKCVGAPFFDKWYETKTSFSRVIKNAKHADRDQYILYFGSSTNIIPDEEEALSELCRILTDRYAGEVKLYFKPHPAVRSYPKVISNNFNLLEKNPILSEADVGFMGLVKNALFVTGVNTSAFLDSIVLGAKVLPIIMEASNQATTQHFKMLSSGLVELIHLEDICIYVDREMNKTQEFPKLSSKLLIDFFPNGGNSAAVISSEIQVLAERHNVR
jgi:hypothetical protein